MATTKTVPEVTRLSSFEESSEGSTSTNEKQVVPAEPNKKILSPVLEEYDVHLGGAAMGKAFRRAARYYLHNKAPALVGNYMKSFVGSEDLLPGVGPKVEDPFYVCDLGVVVSQFYRWKRMLPRVVPFYAVKCNPDRKCYFFLSFEEFSLTDIFTHRFQIFSRCHQNSVEAWLQFRLCISQWDQPCTWISQTVRSKWTTSNHFCQSL